MDSITQGLLGAAVAECGFRHRLGRGATLMGAVGGVLPDLDIFLGWVDPWWTMQYHRHFTHSVFFAPLVAAPLAWLFWRRRKEQRFALWLLCAYLVVATHPLLDLLTTYGTKLFAPFVDARYGLDWIGIIDLHYTAVLIVTIVACVVLRRLRRSSKTWCIGAGGIVVSTGYLLYGAHNHATAMTRIYDHATERGEQVLAARAIPNIGSVYVWRLIYRTNRAYYVGRTNTRFNAESGFTRLPIKDHALIHKADELPYVQLFRNFAMGWARPILAQGALGPSVVYDDLRYRWPPGNVRSLWSAVVEFDRHENVRSVYRATHRSRTKRSVGQLWRDFWRELDKP